MVIRGIRRLRGTLLVAAGAALAVATTAVAGSGVGGTFNLGQTNSVDAPSVLTGNSGSGAQLRVENTGAGPALALVSGAGVAPFKVGSSVKVGNLNSDLLDGLDSTGLPYWKLGGNAGTTPGTNFLGTTDAQTLEFRVNGGRALRLEPGLPPNFIVGESTATPGVQAATIMGANRVTDNSGTVSGGLNNQAGDAAGTVVDRRAATVGGGASNRAEGEFSTVGGGNRNVAVGVEASIGGGVDNDAAGDFSTVPGGELNEATGVHSFAAGFRAKAIHGGSFVWADSKVEDFSTTANDQFLVRAHGGARFVADVHVQGALTKSFAPGTAKATPVAYGAITSAGATVATASSPNVSSTFDAVNKRYVITIANQAYDISHFTTVVTPTGSTPHFVSTQGSGGKLLVKVFDLTGALVQFPFSFITYTP